jgi:hypothetical protein
VTLEGQYLSPAPVANQKDTAQPLSAAQMRSEAQALTVNQHKDDDALELYERVERHRTFSGASPARAVDDKTYRVVPTGSGTMKIQLKEGDAPVAADMYKVQLQGWETLLETMVHPEDSKAKTAYDKYRKRQMERAQLVDAMNDAFVPTQLASETRNGHLCDVFELNPNPAYHPRSIFEEALAHVVAKMWIDRETLQLVRGEARVVKDFPVGGGLVGKLYRGSAFSMDQEPVTPGVWLPIHYQYDFSGRKFLFPFEEHQMIDASHYVRVGPPKEALVLVQNELASGKSFVQDP